MKKSLLILALALGAVLPCRAQTYAVDTKHSQVNFSIKHMAISTVRGRFGVQSGEIVYDAAHPEKSSVTAVVDVASVDTGVEARDNHLRSKDFFDATTNPTATFVSTSVKKAGEGLIVAGNLTLHGVTKPVTLKLDEVSKSQIGMDSKPHRGFSATTTIHRADFGLTWNGVLKSGDAAIGDDATLTFDIEGVEK